GARPHPAARKRPWGSGTRASSGPGPHWPRGDTSRPPARPPAPRRGKPRSRGPATRERPPGPSAETGQRPARRSWRTSAPDPNSRDARKEPAGQHGVDPEAGLATGLELLAENLVLGVAREPVLVLWVAHIRTGRVRVIERHGERVPAARLVVAIIAIDGPAGQLDALLI